MLTELDLNLLNALHALLTERHVTRAGKLIGLSQPATSAALARLRRYFDDDLLVRTGNSYFLTPVAEQLLEPLDEVMRQIDRVLGLRARFDPSTSQRELCIILSDYALFLLMRPLLAATSVVAPNVRIRLEAFGSSEGTFEEGIDLLIAPPMLFPDLSDLPLWSDPWVIAVAKDNGNVEEEMATPLLSTLPYVRFQTAKVPNPADSQLLALGFDLRITASVSSFLGALYMVADTDSFTLVPGRLAHRFADVAGARVLSCPVPLTPLEEHLYWPDSRSNDQATTWLRDLVVKVAADI